MDFANKKVLVVGAGISGLAAIEVLLSRGAHIAVCDQKNQEAISSILPPYMLDRIKIFDSYPEVNHGDFDLVIVSPGIKLEIPPIAQALTERIPVIGEMELAYLIKSPNVQIFAITGTNGKTTTTTLLHKILADAGRKSAAGGNIGVALTTLLDKMSEGIVVAEVSSFQLDTIGTFRPPICGLLNITPDHLDRHKTIENYVDIKSKIFMNQLSDDYAVFNYEDQLVRELSNKCPSNVIFFSTEREVDSGAYIKNNTIIVKLENIEKPVCPVSEILLRGRHNLENILCATAMATLAGVEPEEIACTLKGFAGVRHRLEEVMFIEEVLYVNDSKGTNPESSIKAIESFANPVILIAGGRNKGSSFDLLAQTIKTKVKDLILLGEAKEEIKSSVMTTGFKNIHEVEDLESAVEKARRMAQKGDVVLLSPACASWDMFANYEQRGDVFCNAVKSLNQSRL